MKDKIVLIGAAGAGESKSVARILAEKNLTLDDITIIDSSRDIKSQIDKLKEEKVFEITKLPELPEPFIDPKKPVFNQKKHNKTCAKNRKRRKKRKRRK